MLTKYLSVFLISMVPLIELRGAIPVGVAMGLPLWQVYVIAIIGNMLPPVCACPITSLPESTAGIP